ncbi:MAG: DinB family protein [Pyrinomonadaceae bacterium]
MSKGKEFAREVKKESVSAKKMLERIGPETFDWKPHEKSMTMKRLAGLVADMFGWFVLMVDHDELDFAKSYEQPDPKTTDDLVAWFDKKYAAGIASLEKADDSVFSQSWKLRNGDAIYMETTKGEVCRETINHLVHHRGQLSVYLRLNDIAVPSIYGPSADEGEM